MSDGGGTDSVAFDPRALDAVERRFWHSLWEVVVPEAVEEHGGVRECFGPVQASLVVDLPDERRMNLVLGATEPGAVADGHLEAALEWIEYFGVDYMVPVTPGTPDTEAAEALLSGKGYRPGGSCTRFVREAVPAEAPEPPGLELIELEDDCQQCTFSEMVAKELGVESWVATFFFDLALRGDWHCYMALVDDAPVATAAMWLFEGIAGLCFPSTVPLAASLGCQAALLNRRIADAAEAGCHMLFAETGESLAAHPEPLREELLAVGFQKAYERVNWGRP